MSSICLCDDEESVRRRRDLSVCTIQEQFLDGTLKALSGLD